MSFRNTLLATTASIASAAAPLLGATTDRNVTDLTKVKTPKANTALMQALDDEFHPSSSRDTGIQLAQAPSNHGINQGRLMMRQPFIFRANPGFSGGYGAYGFSARSNGGYQQRRFSNGQQTTPGNQNSQTNINKSTARSAAQANNATKSAEPSFEQKTLATQYLEKITNPKIDDVQKKNLANVLAYTEIQFSKLDPSKQNDDELKRLLEINLKTLYTQAPAGEVLTDYMSKIKSSQAKNKNTTPPLTSNTDTNAASAITNYSYNPAAQIKTAKKQLPEFKDLSPEQNELLKNLDGVKGLADDKMPKLFYWSRKLSTMDESQRNRRIPDIAQALSSSAEEKEQIKTALAAIIKEITDPNSLLQGD